LNEYFDKQREFTDEEIKDLKQLAALKKKAKKDPGAAAEAKVVYTQLQSKRQAFVKVRIQLLTDSFKHHDKSGDGKLSEEESKIVFTHITQEKRGHDQVLANECVRKELMADLGMNKLVFEAVNIPSEDEIKKQYDTEEKAEAEMQYDDVKKKVDQLLADYTKNKEARDRAAFMVLDKSRDGRINKKEFLEAFDPTSPLHVAFMSALGLNSDVEVKNISGVDTTKKDKNEEALAAAVKAGDTKMDVAPAPAPATVNTDKAPEASQPGQQPPEAYQMTEAERKAAEDAVSGSQAEIQNALAVAAAAAPAVDAAPAADTAPAAVAPAAAAPAAEYAAPAAEYAAPVADAPVADAPVADAPAA
jgi:Ca2+-binding EF-hand superfamily protein